MFPLEVENGRVVESPAHCQWRYINLVDVKDLFILSFEHKLEVGHKSTLCEIFQLLVLTTPCFQGVVDGVVLLGILTDLVDNKLLILESFHKLLLGGCHQSKCPSFASEPSSPTDPVHISLHIFRNVHLDDPVDLWEVQSSGCNVGAK